MTTAPAPIECDECARLYDEVDRAERMDLDDPARMGAVTAGWNAIHAHQDEHRAITAKMAGEREKGQ
jgi:hypothetical protein